MAKKKRKNPHRLPVSKADIERLRIEATNGILDYLYSLSMGVLMDDFGFTVDDLRKWYKRMEYHSDSILQGYTKVHDYRQMLKDEAGVKIKTGFYVDVDTGGYEPK